MAKYINLGKQLVRLYRLNLACEDVIKEFLLSAEYIDVPEKRTGEWIEEVGMLMCSECGDAWGTQQFDEVMSFNYCPNCGVKMKGEE